jgi:hypothetical protein
MKYFHVALLASLAICSHAIPQFGLEQFGQQSGIPALNSIEDFQRSCMAHGGSSAWNAFVDGATDMQPCLMNAIDFHSVQYQMATIRSSGDLLKLMNSVCGRPMDKAKVCVKDIIDVAYPCLSKPEQKKLRLGWKMVDYMVDYICEEKEDLVEFIESECGGVRRMDQQCFANWMMQEKELLTWIGNNAHLARRK